MMNVVLCISEKADNLNRAFIPNTLAEQKAYFDGLTKKQFTNVKTVPLGQPFRIQSPFADCLGYNYGWIDYGDNFRYYFSIRDMIFISESMTEIYYDIDALETAYHQKGMSFPRAHVTRLGTDSTLEKYSKVKEMFVVQPFYEYVVNANKLGITYYFAYYRRDSSQNVNYAGIVEIGAEEIKTMFSGDWIRLANAGFQESDIWNIAFVPAICDQLGTPQYQNESGTIKIYEQSIQNRVSFYVKYPSISLTNIGYERDILVDARGCECYSPALGETVTITDGRVNIGASTITVQYGLQSNRKDTLSNAVIPCEQLDLIVDSWAEYYYRQRDADIQARKIDAKKSLANIGSNTGQSAVAGALAGSVVPGVGTALGAVAGAVVGSLGSLVSTGVNYYYGGKEQELTDQTYQKALDSLTQQGSFCESMLIKGVVTYARVTWDYPSRLKYSDDNEAGGKHCDQIITDLDIVGHGILKITADVEVRANLPTAWIEQIQRRFSNGLVIENG